MQAALSLNFKCALFPPSAQIKYAELRDSGQYQCQVNTEPKMSKSVFLSVRGE